MCFKQAHAPFSFGVTHEFTHKAPLTLLQDKKRRFLNHFKTLLKQHIPNDGDGWIIVDAFGGSGLLAHTANRFYPKRGVIYNDFDGYAERLQNINDTNKFAPLLPIYWHIIRAIKSCPKP